MLSCGLLLGACSSGDSVAARMARASTYLGSGEFRSATIELKNVLQSQPEHEQAWFTLGQVSLASGQYADAAEQFRRAREYGMTPQQVNTPLARALIGEGNFKEALEVLHPDAASDAAARAEIHSLQGRAYLGLENRKQAGQAFDAALAARPGYPAALVGQARLAQAAGDGARARQLLARAIESDPTYGPAWAARGNLAFRQGRCADVVEVFDHIQALDANALPPGPVFLARAHTAHCQLQQGEFDKATANIDVLMKMGPDHPYANYLKGVLAYQNENYDQATVHVQKVLAVAPGSTQSVILMGMVKAAQGDLAAAQFHFTEAVSQAPDHLRARELLASVYIRRELPEQAIEVLQEVLDEHGSEPRVLALLAEASVRAGKQAKGLQYLKSSARHAADNTDLQMALAQRMAQIGDAEGALALLEQMELSDDREALKAALLKIAVYLQNDQAAQAISEAQALVRKHPDDVRMARLVARIYLAAGQAADARATLEDALQAAPDNAGVRLDIGALALRDADFGTANAIFEAVLDAHPDNVRAMLAMAQSAALQGQTEQVTTWLEKARELRPDSVDIRVALIRAYLEQDRAADALPVVESLVAVAPDNARVHRLQAVVLFAAGQGQAALASLKKAVAMAPGVLALRLDLARMLIAQDQLDAAVRELQGIRNEHPGHVPAASMLAMTQLRQGRADAALATADSLRTNGENTATSYALTGELMRAQGKYEAAAEAYAKVYRNQPTRGLALRLFEMRRRGGLPHPEKSLIEWNRQHPNDGAVMAALAQWYQVTGAIDAAAEQYRALLAVDPNNAIALNNLALVYFGQGDSRALGLAERAYEAAPRSPAITDTLGWILVQQGDMRRGLPLIRQAAQAAPALPELQYHLAAALSRTDDSADRAKAKSILTKMLASDQPFASRAEAMELLKRIQ